VIVWCFLVLGPEVYGISAVDTTREQLIMDGEFWREQVLNKLMPLWYEHVRDEEHGAFYLKLIARLAADASLGSNARNDQPPHFQFFHRRGSRQGFVWC